jgi:hypothetical protein
MSEGQAAHREAEAHVDEGRPCADCSERSCATAEFPNGGGGIAIYPVCEKHKVIFQRRGVTGLPRIWMDCKITVMMSPYNPANSAAFKFVN